MQLKILKLGVTPRLGFLLLQDSNTLSGTVSDIQRRLLQLDEAKKSVESKRSSEACIEFCRPQLVLALKRASAGS